MQLKPHDTVVALKYGCLALESVPDVARERISVRSIAASLGLSAGEISKSCQRLLKAKLIAPVGGGDGSALPYNLVRIHMEEWLNYGIQYNVIPEPTGVGRGLVTGWSNTSIRSEFVPRELPYVWLVAGGDLTGEGVSPLYPNAAVAAGQDRHLHYILSLIDAIRLGKPREIGIARALVRNFLEEVKDAQ
jgi:hypothetical protein